MERNDSDTITTTVATSVVEVAHKTRSAKQPTDKTTIQLLVRTVDRLVGRKRGNDTYDDVINRDIDTCEKQEPQV